MELHASFGFEPTTNYLAVLVAALAYWFLGAIWFTALFGKQWMALTGMTEQKAKEGALLAYVGSFVMMFILGLIMSCWVDYYGADDAASGAKAGLWAWLGFVVTTGIINGLFERTKPMLYVINYGYHLLGCVITGVVVAVWV